MSDESDRSGTILDGKYELERLIGTGGMGSVYLARQLQLDRQVAIKVLRPDVTADDRAVARFNREARAAARIEHPNAVRVYDFGSTDDGLAFIVMEYVEGVPLRVMMHRSKILPFDVVLEVIWQAASAIAVAHATGIVHRDLKPENFMVRVGDDGTMVVKVVDFGLAKLVGGESAQITSPAEIIGTPRYMAPEQFLGDEIDERIDVYALGVVVFEMLAGRAPFDGTFSEVVGKHLYAEVPTFESLGVEAPPGVEIVVRRALAKKPAERTSTVLDLARDLAKCFGVEVPAGTAFILPAAMTSRSSLVLPDAAVVEDEDLPPEHYRTNVESRDGADTMLRGSPARSAPEIAVDTSRPVGTSSSSRVGLWVGVALGIAMLGVLLVGIVGAVAAWRAQRTPSLAESPATSGATPGTHDDGRAPSPGVASSPDTEEEDDDGGVKGLDGVPFYVAGKLVVYGDKADFPTGTLIVIRDPRSGERERFQLEPNVAATRWVVGRDARSIPGGRSVEELVPAHTWVEIVMRRPDGTETAPRLITRSDE